MWQAVNLVETEGSTGNSVVVSATRTPSGILLRTSNNSAEIKLEIQHELAGSIRLARGK